MTAFPKSFPKLIPSCFQDKERDTIEIILKSLDEPKSAKELVAIVSCSIRTVKDKYLEKLLQVGIIAMTIPDKPTSSKQRYKLVMNQE